MSTKRPWDDIDDVDELKAMLDDQADKLHKLKRQCASLKQHVKDSDEAADAAGGGSSAPSKAQAKQQAAQAAKSLRSMLAAQMVYKPSVKHGSARVSAELPGLSLAAVQALLGEDLLANASNGPKQLAVVVSSDDDIADVLGDCPSKSLRYGARLRINTTGLKFVFLKESGLLKVTGSYSMDR